MCCSVADPGNHATSVTLLCHIPRYSVGTLPQSAAVGGGGGPQNHCEPVSARDSDAAPKQTHSGYSLGPVGGGSRAAGAAHKPSYSLDPGPDPDADVPSAAPVYSLGPDANAPSAAPVYSLGPDDAAGADAGTEYIARADHPGAPKIAEYSVTAVKDHDERGMLSADNAGSEYSLNPDAAGGSAPSTV